MVADSDWRSMLRSRQLRRVGAGNPGSSADPDGIPGIDGDDERDQSSGLIDEVIAAQTRDARHPSTVDQLALAELIASGVYDRHVRRRRLAYRRRRDRLVAALQSQVPQVRVTGIAAGMHAVVELADGQSEDDIVVRAAQHGLAIEGLSAYCLAEQVHRPSLVIGYGSPPEHLFTSALSRLTTVLKVGARGVGVKTT